MVIRVSERERLGGIEGEGERVTVNTKKTETAAATRNMRNFSIIKK